MVNNSNNNNHNTNNNNNINNNQCSNSTNSSNNINNIRGDLNKDRETLIILNFYHEGITAELIEYELYSIITKLLNYLFIFLNIQYKI